MKIKTLLIAFVACLFVLALTSCNRIDAKLTAFEKSVNKLENNYKDLSPKALEKAVKSCQKRYEELEKLEKTDMSINQSDRFRDIAKHYAWLLIKINWYTIGSDKYNSSEGKSVIEYLLELLGPKAGTSIESLEE